MPWLSILQMTWALPTTAFLMVALLGLLWTKELRCISVKGSKNGWDLLREQYSGFDEANADSDQDGVDDDADNDAPDESMQAPGDVSARHHEDNADSRFFSENESDDTDGEDEQDTVLQS